MPRALIIKNANFAANRVAVIDIESSVDCTGIELEQSTITVTNDAEVTVAYTVTPSNTTDDILWTSSNESVATVDDNVVTILGIGTTTITATCGSFSDTLVLTADLYAVPDWYASTPSIITDSSDNSIVRADLNTSASARLFAAQNSENSKYSLPFYNANDNELESLPIWIPNGCDKIHVSASNLYGSNNDIFWVDALQPVTYANTVVSCEALSSETLTVSSNAVDQDLTVPEGANGFAIRFRLRTAPAEGTTIAEAGASTNLSIHFLATE